MAVTFRVRLPTVSTPASYYRMVFTLADKSVVTSGKITEDGGFIACALPYAVTKLQGKLLMQVQAVGEDSGEVSYLWPTLSWEFKVEEGVNKTLNLDEIENPDEGTLEYELQQLIRLATGAVSIYLSRNAIVEKTGEISTDIEVCLYEGGNIVLTSEWGCDLHLPPSVIAMVDQMEDRYVLHISRLSNTGDFGEDRGDIEIIAGYKGGLYTKKVQYVCLHDDCTESIQSIVRLPDSDIIGETTGGETQTEAMSTVYPLRNKSIFIHSPTLNTTYTFDVSGLGDLTDKAVIFQLHINMPGVPVALTFMADISWTESPDMNSGNTTYCLVFQSKDGGLSWRGNLADADGGGA